MRTTGNLRLQSAVDYLTTYGWAIIVISISLAFIYFYVQGQVLLSSSTCAFGTVLRCTDLIFGSNSMGTYVQITLANGQEYAIANVVAALNLTNYGTYTMSCSPYYVLPGGKIMCTVPSRLPVLGINTGASGYLVVNESVCTVLGSTSCQTHIRESFNGTFSSTVGPSITPISCTMNANTIPSSLVFGTASTVYANVLISGQPVAGITVGFSTTSTHASFSQDYALTNANGTASVSVFDTQAESVPITVNSLAGCMASNTLTFT